MKFKGLKVGDRVYIHGHGNGSEHPVTKVGRKYFTAWGREFRLEDGRGNSGYTFPYASTLEERAIAKRVEDARKALVAFGIDFTYGTKDDKVLMVYEALTPVLLPSTETKP